MKNLILPLVALALIGCVGHVNVSTQTPANTDLEIVIKSTKHEPKE